MDTRIVIKGKRAYIYTPYNRSFVADIKAVPSASWTGEAWEILKEDLSEAKEIVEKHYGECEVKEKLSPTIGPALTAQDISNLFSSLLMQHLQDGYTVEVTDLTPGSYYTDLPAITLRKGEEKRRISINARPQDCDNFGTDTMFCPVTVRVQKPKPGKRLSWIVLEEHKFIVDRAAPVTLSDSDTIYAIPDEVKVEE